MIHRLLNLLNQETVTAEVRLLAETRKAIKVEPKQQGGEG